MIQFGFKEHVAHPWDVGERPNLKFNKEECGTCKGDYEITFVCQGCGRIKESCKELISLSNQ